MSAPARDGRAKSFLEHLHAPLVSERTLRFSTTWGLGLASILLFAVLTVSGGLLALVYVPEPHGAYASMTELQFGSRLGAFLRALHRWSAHAMVVTVGLHLLRVLAVAAYTRRRNFLYGMGLGWLVLAFAFTGYLLPWDQQSVWAIQVSAGALEQTPLIGPWLRTLFLGGPELGEATLLRFYAGHVAILPLATALLLVLHLFRLRRDDGLVHSPEAPRGAMLPARAELLPREKALAACFLAVLMLGAAFVDAPLGPPADLTRPDNPEKAPWYFLWLQESASFSTGQAFSLMIAGLLLPLLAWIDPRPARAGVWLHDRDTRFAALGAALLAAGALILAYTLGWPVVWVQWGVVLVASALAGWRARARRPAILVAVVVFALSLVGLAIAGSLRGADWQFTTSPSDAANGEPPPSSGHEGGSHAH